MKLLVVDFDTFFPVIERTEDERFPGERFFYDWGHSEEASVFYEAIWPTRAEQFIAAGRELPRCDEKAMSVFWSRFMFAPMTSLFMADSNMYAVHERVRRNIDEVWLFDAHHDAGYSADAPARVVREQSVDCGNWMLGYIANDTPVHMRYPAWRTVAFDPQGPEGTPPIPIDRQYDDGSTPPVVFDRVFLCKSPAWVPSWCDDQWARFVASSPFRRKVTIPLDFKMQRTFDLAAAERDAEQWRALREALPQ